MSDKELKEFYDKAFALSVQVEPSMAAGVYIAQAMRIYKTVLNDEEFNRMVDTISDGRDKIRPLGEGLPSHKLH